MILNPVRGGSLAALLVAGALLQAQSPTDWPQWRGPHHDGSVAGFIAPKSWPAPLTQKWRAAVGLGYATPILVGNRVFMFTRRGENEVIAAIDANTGEEQWQTGYPAPFAMNPAAARHGQGPKSTPAFANGRLFTLGMGGVVTAFDANTGKQIWQKPGSTPGPLYATGMSPLVDGDAVIVHVGSHNHGALTAFNVANGSVKWSWTGDGPSYGSPVIVEIDGTRQVVTCTQENIVGVSAASGELLWKKELMTRLSQNAITPVVYNGTIIISGLDNPVSALRIAKRNGQWSADTLWENAAVPLYMANPVIINDLLFGMTHKNSGQLFLLDPRTGRTVWTGDPRFATNAAIVRAGDLAFVLKDSGELLVGRPGPAGFEVLKQYQVANSSTWAVPVIAGSRIFVKDEEGLTLWGW